ncbi:MAG: DUF4149 domain-containing protein [Gemmataceae bacterium]|nr:DUF4149 domain-containing protein [Gemmataceae bacterium]
MAKVLHVLALGLWFGGAAFFNFAAAPAIFTSFKQVVYAGPSDRTAGRTIIDPAAKDAEKDALASALAGAAVGPVFPRYFGMQAVCGVVAVATAARWRRLGRVHEWRFAVVLAAAVTVAAAIPLSDHVSELRVRRFDPDPAVSSAAKAAFGPWHLASLGLSVVTVGLAGVGLALAAKLPADPPRESY